MSFGWAWKRSSMSFNRTLLDFRSKVRLCLQDLCLYESKISQWFLLLFDFNLKSFSFSFYFDFVLFFLILLTLSLDEKEKELLILAMSKSWLFQAYVFIIFSPVLDCFQPNPFHIVQVCMCFFFSFSSALWYWRHRLNHTHALNFMHAVTVHMRLFARALFLFIYASS